MSQGEQSSDDCPVEASVIKQILISLVLEHWKLPIREELREDGETTHLFLLAAQHLEAGGTKLGTRLGNNTTARS